MAVDKDIIEQLMPWLLANLHSTELNANDMADYVVSLVSASGTREQLYERCGTELEEFLGTNTRPFVDALFGHMNQLQNQKNAGQLGAPQPIQLLPAEPQPVPQQEPTLSGGQEEFRRNFRAEPPPNDFSMRRQQRFNKQQNNQFSQFPNMPGMPGMLGMPNMPGMPSFPGFSTGMQGFPNQGGFQKGNWRYDQPFGGQPFQPRKKHGISAVSSYQNELSVANKRLVVEGIPDEHLSDDAVRQYFGRFGNLTNVRVDSNQKLAEIEYEGHDQAVQAHKSPEPIFGNRFVKVFWRKRRDSSGNGEGNEVEPEPELDLEAVKRMQDIKQQQFEEKERKRKELTERLKKGMAEQAQLLQQRSDLIKSGQGTLEQHAEAQQRSEQLMAETSELKKELTALNGRASTGPTRGGYRGRGGFPRGGAFRGCGGSFRGSRGAFSGALGKASLDRRPKGVMLQGVDAEKDQALRELLASHNYTDFTRQDPRSVVIEFADRRSAEDFFNSTNNIAELSGTEKQYVRTLEKPSDEMSEA